MKDLSRALRPVLPLLLAAFLLAGTATAQQRPDFVSIGTASAAGAYFPLGVAMADLWNRNISGTHFSAQETGGGVANINMMANGEIELGIANAYIPWDAHFANPPFEQPIDVLGGWVMNESYVFIVAPERSGITTVADLAGKRVSFGAPGSSSNVIGQRMLQSQGLEDGSYSAVYLGWQESADAIADGSLDAAVMAGGQPLPAAESLAVRMPMVIVGFDESKLASSEGFPLVARDIPAGTYHGVDVPGPAIFMPSNVYVDADLDEDLVYEMVKAIFENVPALAAAHPSGDEAALISEAEAEQLELTMHPGAIKYAKEVGAW